jgi:hypothetical protein
VCSCWRCAVERLCKALEHVEALDESLSPCPRWDVDLSAEVEALDREILSEQELDGLRRLEPRGDGRKFRLGSG